MRNLRMRALSVSVLVLPFATTIVSQVAKRLNRWALSPFVAIFILTACAVGQNSYGVSFTSVSVTPPQTTTGPFCTITAYFPQGAPVIFNLIVPASQVVKTDQGWVPFTISSPYSGNGIISVSINQSGIATGFESYTFGAGVFPNVDGGNVVATESIDLNTGAYSYGSSINYIGEVDPCSGIDYIDEIDPATGLPYAGPQSLSLHTSYLNPA